jgi:hypothetical protein
VIINGHLVVTFNEIGLAAAVAGLVSMTVGAARKGVSEGLLVRVLADWDMGEVELHAVFPARKSCEAIRACIRRLACFKCRLACVMTLNGASTVKSRFGMKLRYCPRLGASRASESRGRS